MSTKQTFHKDAKEIVLEILKDKEKGMKNNKLSEKYVIFKNECPRLFEMLIDNGKSILPGIDLMLNKIKDLNEDKITKFNADTEISSKLAEQYLHPVVGKPTAEAAASALEIVKKKQDIVDSNKAQGIEEDPFDQERLMEQMRTGNANTNILNWE